LEAPVSRLSIRIAAAPLAILLSVVLATDATATSWAGNRALTASGGGYAYGGGLAVSSTKVAHAIYEQWVLGSFTVFYRRSADSGTTWGTPLPLSRPDVGEAGVPSIDAAGNAVDAVWVEGDSIFSGLDSIVVYRGSTDGGLTWKDPIQISPTLGRAGYPRVVHAASGHVLVTWTDQVAGRVYARLSTNSGVSFGSTMLIATTANHPLSNHALYEAFPTVAAGTGVIYVAYFSASHTVLLRRSTNGGSTWASAKTVATNGSGFDLAIAAHSSTVLVGYALKTSKDIYTVVRRSTDKGAHWGSVVAISAASSYPSFAPVLTYRSGKFLAAFEKCTSNSCSRSNVYYRSSTTGSSWSSTTLVSVRHRTYDYPADVEVATKILILYDDTSSTAGDVYVRQGS
jgi:hypothetical protein